MEIWPELQKDLIELDRIIHSKEEIFSLEGSFLQTGIKNKGG
jgi:hypothetical protein